MLSHTGGHLATNLSPSRRAAYTARTPRRQKYFFELFPLECMIDSWKDSAVASDERDAAAGGVDAYMMAGGIPANERSPGFYPRLIAFGIVMPMMVILLTVLGAMAAGRMREHVHADRAACASVKSGGATSCW